MCIEISEMEALELVENGEWIFGNDIVSCFDGYNKLVPENSNFSSDLDAIRKLGSDANFIHEITESAHIYLNQFCETRHIQNKNDDTGLVAFRISEHFVYKLGDSSYDIFKNFFLIVSSSVALTPITGPIGWIPACIAATDLIRTIMGAFEKLVDPKEQLVFESIYKLERRPQIINYDAYAEKNFEKAYGNVWPTELEIVNDLNDFLNKSEVTSSLNTMRQRAILEVKNGRWEIRI